ncbi:unnamed protein product [Enterobius vermicularis]|uniref:SERPIN domain-containing protein n=1 Tax=Enterobius vermicularis TaxID=51028 RepID=A0A0N4V5C2_ENTVE|nr:unnamed protein product [Enterobius vermicularis]
MAYALLHLGEDLRDAAGLINEAGGKQEIDLTDIPVQLQEYINAIKDAADKESNEAVQRKINAWIAATLTGIERPCLH